MADSRAAWRCVRRRDFNDVVKLRYRIAELSSLAYDHQHKAFAPSLVPTRTRGGDELDRVYENVSGNPHAAVGMNSTELTKMHQEIRMLGAVCVRCITMPSSITA
jgi:hypothetical protein